MDAIKLFPYHSPNRRHTERRYAIVERTDGFYTIVDQYYFCFSDENGTISAEGWHGQHHDGIYDNLASAEREIQSRISLIS